MKKPNSVSGHSLPTLVSRSALAVFPILLALAALSLMGCMTDSEKGPNRTLTNSEYQNHDIGLKIDFPASWKAQMDQVIEGTKVDLIIVDDSKNGFRPNLTVIHSPHSGPTLMSEVLPQLKSELQAQTSDISQYQDSIININGKEVGRIDFESTVNGALLHFRAMFFVNNGRDVSITLTDRADDFAINTDVQGMFNGISITPK